MSDTPRTDREAKERSAVGNGYYVHIDFARELERENAKLRDPEAIIKACVPGGQICDPQTVADAIRGYFNR